MQIVHQTQPEHSHLCGQTCVAMVTGRPLDEVCRFVRTRGYTNFVKLRKALRQMGVGCGNTLPFKGQPLDGTHIVTIKKRGARVGHFIIINGNHVHDPGYPHEVLMETYELVMKQCEYRITSVMQVWCVEL